MPPYRVYRLNKAGRIVGGDWIDAADEAEARSTAHAMCDDDTPTVELWQAARRIAVLACNEG
jgi:hypothetical protein